MKRTRVLIISFACVGIGMGTARADTVTKNFAAKDIKYLELRNGEGKVHVSSSDSAQAMVAADKVKFDKSCSLTIDQSHEKLLVEVKDDSFLSRGRCQVDFSITVPRDIAVDLKSGSGPIFVKGTKGRINYQTGSGSVSLDGEITNLDGRSGSGDIDIKGLVGGGELKSGSGDIRVTYTRKPDAGTLELKTGSGDMTIYLPAESKVATDFKAGSGRLTNELGDTANAAFSIVGKAGSGNLRIKKAL